MAWTASRASGWTVSELLDATGTRVARPPLPAALRPLPLVLGIARRRRRRELPRRAPRRGGCEPALRTGVANRRRMLSERWRGAPFASARLLQLEAIQQMVDAAAQPAPGSLECEVGEVSRSSAWKASRERRTGGGGLPGPVAHTRVWEQQAAIKASPPSLQPRCACPEPQSQGGCRAQLTPPIPALLGCSRLPGARRDEARSLLAPGRRLACLRCRPAAAHDCPTAARTAAAAASGAGSCVAHAQALTLDGCCTGNGATAASPRLASEVGQRCRTDGHRQQRPFRRASSVQLAWPPCVMMLSTAPTRGGLCHRCRGPSSSPACNHKRASPTLGAPSLSSPSPP
jgi:hypothetical protein